MRKVVTQLFLQRKGIKELLSKLNCQSVQGSCAAASAIAARHGLKAGTPAELFAKTCLCATLLPFPVVKAWSVWNKKETKDDIVIQAFAKTLRLKRDTSDKALVEALYKADDLYKNGEVSDHAEILKVLEEHRSKKEPELLWRLARITYEFAKKAETAQEKAKLMDDAFQLVTNAIEMDDSNFAVHKWTAILLNEVSILKGLKEQILQSVNVKKHIMRAVELNPNDATSHYMLGNWCFSVAEVPWYQKKVAATLFATPPESTYDEALQHFLNAENLDPGFYSMNHLMLAKVYIYKGDLDKAAIYLNILSVRRVTTDDDYMAKTEAIELIKKHYKTQKEFHEAAAKIEVVIQ